MKKSLFFVDILKATDEKSRIRSRIWIRNPVFGPAKDPDRSQNVTYPEHCYLDYFLCPLRTTVCHCLQENRLIWCSSPWEWSSCSPRSEQGSPHTALRYTTMDQISIKTPNPKCRHYGCLIEFIDWRYRQSCWYFRPLLWTSVPLTFSLVHLPPPPSLCE